MYVGRLYESLQQRTPIQQSPISLHVALVNFQAARRCKMLQYQLRQFALRRHPLMSRTVIAGSMSADWGPGGRGGILHLPNGDRSGVVAWWRGGVASMGNHTTIRSVVHLFFRVPKLFAERGGDLCKTRYRHYPYLSLFPRNELIPRNPTA